MPGDGVQNHVPVNLYRGATAASPTTVSLTSGYDYVITSVWIANASGTNPANIYLEDASGHQFHNVTIPNYPNAGFVSLSSGLWIVLPSPASFSIIGPSSGSLLSVDGFLVVPGSASFLPT